MPPRRLPVHEPEEEEEEEESGTDDDQMHLVAQVVVQLQYTVTVDKGKGTASKSKATKKKVETKTKDFPFTFEATQANYLTFLSTLLEKHRHAKFTPVTTQTRFTIKAIVPPNKAKKDAIDVDNFSEYERMAKKVIEEKPSKFFVFVNLDDDASESDDDNESDGVQDDKKRDDERAIARNRVLLEKEYANPADSGYTYVGVNGEKFPLTPAMLNEWSRAMTDGEVSRFNPPNTAAFDPQMRQRSLFQRPPSSTVTSAATSSEASPPLAQASELLREVRKLFGPPSISRRSSSAPPTSPSHNESFGPDVLPFIGEQLLVNCGLTMGDAVRLKRGASSWWASPDAKRRRLHDQPQPQGNFCEPTYHLRFEKRFVDGGSASVFGSGLVPGENHRHRQFTWYFYNEATETVERVPDGFIPTIDPATLEEEDTPYNPSPTPTPSSPGPSNVNANVSNVGEAAGGS
ncbi:hypothetical protein M413DRAFT_14400 [Hebeloma cylindrosporum]|uniref:Uncharacterized protein n=1 Tax=Hebeloma cylindrosporum TaxID=76867 RepID=A0A0C2XCX4_HEBCY|nr:hypothetical protein M413DRAFT_14400 [Hebeloma cylindrosporum h7]